VVPAFYVWLAGDHRPADAPAPAPGVV
jgi:hypothetical protein